MQTTYSIDIAASADKVFHLLDDPEQLPTWLSMVVENEQLHETAERIGTTFRQVVVENGRRRELLGTVTGYEPNKRLTLHLNAKGFDVDVEYILAETDGQTRLTQISDVHFHGLFKLMALLLAPFYQGSAQSQLEKDFAKLKKLCEAEG